MNNTIRLLYDALWYTVGLPCAFARLWVKGSKESLYRERWRERLAYITLPTFKARPFWLHAVSLGEVRAAVPIIRHWLRVYPTIPVVVTTTTPAGSAEVQKTFKESVYHCYLPYDAGGCIRRFLTYLRPQKILIMETEIWPNLFWLAHQQDIPIYIVNARISPRAFIRYRRFRWFFSQVLSHVTKICAQSSEDADRYLAIGAEATQVRVTGNIKFALELPADIQEKGANLRQQLGVSRPILLVASTHAGEEKILLDAFKLILARFPDALLILVPRHANRFEEVHQLCQSVELRVLRRSVGITNIPPTTQVYLGDTMGEMMLLIAASDVVFVGGSLVPIGGHNTLEPASLKKPILSGPQIFNFQTITRLLQANQAIQLLDSAASIANATIRYFEDPALQKQDGERAHEVFARHQDALDRLLTEIH